MELIGQTSDELKLLSDELRMPSFTARQLADWLYEKRVCSFDEMTNISLKWREKLKENSRIGRVGYSQMQQSIDGTKKYLFPVANNKFVETVYIPDKARATVCISTQVGCRMNCLFSGLSYFGM